MLERSDYAGQPAVRYALGPLAVVAPVTFGPRILGLEFQGANVFAMLPDAVLRGSDGRPYHFRGGHRLWVAPEVPAITYRPDDDPVEIVARSRGLLLAGPFDPVTGLRRSISVRLSRAGDAVAVDHVISNEGTESRRLAVWAISQLPLGGRAFLPLQAVVNDPSRRQPDRGLILWPYSRLDDARLELTEGRVEIQTATDQPSAVPLKVGSPGSWLAYLRDGALFVKRGASEPGVAHADLGATAQVYCDDRFIELETLGPLISLAPGKHARHRETWQVVEVANDAEAERILAGIGVAASVVS
jgi:hypothetical protein